MIEILFCILFIIGGYGLKRMLEIENLLTLVLQNRIEELRVKDIIYLHQLQNKNLDKTTMKEFERNQK